MKILLVYNKKTAHKVSAKKLSVVKRLLDEFEIDADIVYTQYSRHAIEIVRNADFSIYDGVIAAGGDGTLYELVNGYFQNTSDKRIPIGIIPVGTGNAFVRDIGFTQPDVRKAIQIIKEQKIRKIDVGSYKSNNQTKYFINILGFGFVTDVVRTAINFKYFGNFAYTIGVFYRMIMLKTNILKIEIDGQKYEYDQLLVELSNSKYTANYLMAPGAEIDDGYLDVLIGKKMSRIKLLTLFSKIFKGKHTDDAYVEVFKAKHIKIEVDEIKHLSPDGELDGATPIEVTCLHKAIDMFAR